MSLDDRVRQGDTTRVMDSAVEKHCEGLQTPFFAAHSYYLNKKIVWNERVCPQHYHIKKDYEEKK